MNLKTRKNGEKRRKTEENAAKRDILPGFSTILASGAEVDLKEVKVTTQEVATLYGVTTQAVSKWRHRGAPSERDGKTYMFPLAELIQWRRQRDIENAGGNEPSEKGETFHDIEYKKFRAQKVRLEVEKEQEKLVYKDAVRMDLMRCVSALSLELEAVGKQYGAAVQNAQADAIERFSQEIGVDGD